MTAHAIPARLSLGRFVVFATLAFAVCFYGIPLLWLFIAGTRSQSSLFTDPPFALGTWEAFSRTWTNLTTYNNFQIVTWATNSLIYSVGGVLLSLVASIPGGYALAASEFPGRKLILVLTLIAMITPSTAVVLPIFLEMNLLGLNNTYVGLILASGFFPFGVYLTYVYFSTSLPKGVMDLRPGRWLQPLPAVHPHRPAAGPADHRAGRVLQLPRHLEQLLPRLRAAHRRQALQPAGRPDGADQQLGRAQQPPVQRRADQEARGHPRGDPGRPAGAAHFHGRAALRPLRHAVGRGKGLAGSPGEATRLPKAASPQGAIATTDPITGRPPP